MASHSPQLAERPATRRNRRPVGEPPPLPREFSKWAWILLAALVVTSAMWLFAIADEEARVGIWFNVQEGALLRELVELRTAWLTSVAKGINSVGAVWAVPIIGWTAIVLMAAAKRLRHLFVYFGCLIATSGYVTVIALEVERARPWGIDQLAGWEGFAHPSLPIAQLSAVIVGAAYGLVSRDRGRRWFLAAGAVAVAVLGLSRMYLGLEYPTDVLWAIIGGAAVTVTAFLVICPEKVFPVGFQRGRTAHLDLGGPRGEAIQRAVSDQLGIGVTDVTPFGLADSAGSTPMLVTTSDGERLFGKLYASSHLRSDRWYKLGRTLLYGRLEDEGRFTNVRRLVEREDYLLRVMQDAGVRAPAPYGIATITPEREYLIVTEFLAGAEELTSAEVDDLIIEDALGLVRRMWDHGLAHRDIKPSNVMVRDGQAYLIDVAFGQMRPSPWREAIDLANMMLTLALRSSSDRVYEKALRLFTADEIAEAFAAARGITLPSQLRRELKAGSRDLMEEFRRLGPARPPLPIQRWSVRRVGLALWVLMLATVGLVLGVGNLQGIGLLGGQEQSGSNTPWCDEWGVLFLEAQSMTSAQLVPCLDALPLGWEPGETRIDDAGTIFTVDSDLAGKDAVEVALVESCDVRGLNYVRTVGADTQRYEAIRWDDGALRGERAYVFDGGCATIDFRFAPGADRALVDDLGSSLDFMPRPDINDVVVEITRGRDQLDPPTGS